MRAFHDEVLRWVRLLVLIGASALLMAPSCGSEEGGSSGSGATDGGGGGGGTAGDPCVVSEECNPFEISDCDTPCRAFCGPGGTEVYGTCGTNVDPSMPPPGGVYYCECHCDNLECP